MSTDPAGWACGDKTLPVFDRVHVMGILNVTPDSFSDGGAFLDPDDAVKRGIEMAEEGADIIDVGGESTRPGADPVSVEEELERVVPVIREIAVEGLIVSIDTTKSEVAKAALDAGAVIVNDVSGFRLDPMMVRVAAGFGAGVVLMHMKGTPRTMQENPQYDDVVEEVRRELLSMAESAMRGGVPRSSIAIDPGIGFGKTREHNLQLLKWTSSFTDDGYPLLVGPSRKSFIGTTLDLPVDDRVEGTAAAVAWLVATGANVVRVHDVRQMARVVRMTEAIKKA